MATPKDDVQEPIEVTLKKAHRHAGRDYKAGQKIKVMPGEAEFLKKHGVI